MAKTQEKIGYITLMSVFSAFSVVLTHTNRCFWQFSTDSYWLSATIIECLMSFCVPVFFMISGATLIDYRDRYSTKEYFVKRIKRAVIPYVIWCYIGLVYNIIMGYTRIEEITVGKIIKTVISCDSIDIYWFFPILFGVYLCIPLFAAVEKSLRQKLFSYLIVASLIINSVVPFIKMVFKLDFAWPLNVQVASSYLLYVLFGYVISHYETNIIIEIIIYVCGVIGVLAEIFGTYILSMDAGTIDVTYKGFENLPCILYSMAVFMFIKRVGPFIMKKGLAKVINFLGSFTLGIYLTHWYVMEILEKVGIKYIGLDTTSLTYRLGAPFVIIAICILIIWIIRKVPIIRNIVP